ncbi:MAG TPA: type IV pilus assembly protein PilM [Anaerohalosphaeraceae bacterium]|nr:type IV pilus assembly protein PilM [Anaerohalosphaeraceae bacterium]
MAKASHAVWGIDIGTCSLKALRLRQGAEGLEVVGFDYLEHDKILSTADITPEEKRETIRQTLRNFLKQNEVGKEEVAIAIAGQNSFARLVKMPPVDPKRIPKIVPLEAVQQIPFDINEVEWDWQLLKNPDSPDTEVGIFAIKNEVIAEMLDFFSRENLRVSCVQISPIALYNYALYDIKEISASSGKATILLDMGAENTTLVIATRDSVWQRSIRIGGNTFTEAIADAFKLKFARAEKLKRTAPMSKYMRQIFTAMKPVYTDLGGEIQRSLGFYASSGAGRDKGFSRILALGGGFKLQGLTKYLQQSLGLPVIKPDSFERLVLSPDVSAAKFHENLSEFGVVYGLGVQLLGESKIETNLLPKRIARAMAWTRKAKVFTAAASVFLAVSLICLLWTFRLLQQYSRENSGLRTVQAVMQQAQSINSAVSDFESQKPMFEQQVQKEMDLFKYRQIVPLLNETLLKCFPNKENTPAIAELYDAFVNGDLKTIRSIPRGDRKVMFVTRLEVQFAPDLAAAALPQGSRRSMTGYGPGAGFGGEVGGFMGGPVMQPGGMPPEMMPGMPGGEMGTAGVQSATQAGFVVLIEGYSPYKEIAQLLDPPGVGTDQTRWGVVTRFENLKTLFPDTPFELFGKGDIRHFKDESGPVDPADMQMPAGIGILREVERVPSSQAGGAAAGMTAMPGGPVAGGMTGAVPTRITKETVLVDPMTEEEISRTLDIITQEDIKNNPSYTDRDLGRVKQTPFGEPQYIIRDHWFRIQAKFVWKDAPALPELTAGGGMGGGFYPGAVPAGPGGGGGRGGGEF